MEFGKHLAKGVWGFADKALPVFYGVAYVMLVIRVLPYEEFGNFTLVQELFLIISGLATAFALQPMLKFDTEEGTNHEAVRSVALLMNLGFIALSSVLVLAFRNTLSALLNSPNLASLMLYLPAMLAASFLRNFTLILLQTRFLVKKIFLVDAVHFVGAPLLIYCSSKLHSFDSAFDLIVINIISLSLSSVVGIVVTRSMLRFTPAITRNDLRKMWDYGKFSLGGIVIYLFYSKSDSFILSSFAGPVQVAIYNSVKVFTRVYDMVSQVAQMIILPAASKLSSRGDHKSLKILIEKGILFSTVGMLPILILFLFLASPLIGIIYEGRYTEAVPMLQVFSLLSLVVPLIAITTNAVMGLGYVKQSFLVSLWALAASAVIYAIMIPLLGALGATIGYVMATICLAWLSTSLMNRHVMIRISEILARVNDIKVFFRNKLERLL